MYYKYVKEVLIIVSIDVLQANYTEKDNQLKIDVRKLRVGTFPVFPLDIDLTQYDEKFEKDISFLTYRVSTAYIVRKDKSQLYVPSFFNEGPQLKVEFIQRQSCDITMTG